MLWWLSQNVLSLILLLSCSDVHFRVTAVDYISFCKFGDKALTARFFQTSTFELVGKSTVSYHLAALGPKCGHSTGFTVL